MTEKSGRAGVEATKPNTNTPTAKTKRFIESSPRRLFVGGSLARAEARTRERHHPSGGEECRHDRRSGDGVAGRDSKNVQGQRWSPLQRNGRPLGEPHSRHEPIVAHGVNNPVSALHNLLAAVQ